MKITNSIFASNREEWRTWLETNHDKEQEVWLVYFKAQSGKSGIDYEASVEEALCFGWIDSIIQKIDNEKYARKFNPRRVRSYWSSSNKKRMEKLIAEGRMTPVGLAKFDPQASESSNREAQKIRKGETAIPEEVKERVMSNARAWENFQKLAPSHQRQYVSWVMSAKKQETRERRLVELISTLEQGRNLGLK
jgi:uncharacterized protein YdeI (YjbR/CyaY-like superfamily)